jgi:hypothetical protein
MMGGSRVLEGNGLAARAGHRWGRLVCLAIAVVAGLAPAPAARAADTTELWPEANFFVTTGPQTRLFFDAAYANGKETDHPALDAACYLDVSLRPFRKSLQTDDWQRSRYLWARVGFDRVFKGSGDRSVNVAENRMILSVLAKVPLPEAVVLETRYRADLRWIGGEYSTRYRFRAEFTREFAVDGHAVVPFLNGEWFYDTRYDGWARGLYTFGPEVTVSKGFRFEVYGAYQADRLPEKSDLAALGINLKWYFQ